MDIVDIFKQHYEKYDINDSNINRKYYHSLRVMNLSSDIAKYLNLNQEEQFIARVIGLLHDYSRFEQWTVYKTYSDIDSIDHADLAVKRLIDEGEIKLYLEDNKYYSVIYDAIKYHNKLKVDDNVDNKIFCNIIRDADKLDILYLLTIKNLCVEDDKDISKAVESCFYKNVLVPYNLLKSKNDKIILSLSQIFDINFKYSYKYINDNELIKKLFDNIENKDLFKQYFEYADRYVKERI